MIDHSTYSAFVALLNGALALLYGFVWRFQRVAWAGWFATAFALIGLRFLIGPLVPHEPGQVPWLAAVLVCPNAVCMTWGLVSYTDLPERWARVIKPLAAGVGLIVATAILITGLSASVAMPVYAMYLLGWAGMAWWAHSKEPHSAYGVVVFALLAFPLTVITARLGGVDPLLLPYVGGAFMGLTGMTILTTGVLRAHRQVQTELGGRLLAEQNLQALNDSLERRVMERTDELQGLVSALESFNRSVSHDLRGPLGGIGALADMAQTALEQRDLEALRRWLPAISRQAKASTELVSALLLLAQVGEAPLRVQTTDLNRFMRALLSDMGALDPAWSSVQVQPDLPCIKADPDLLRPLLTNLIGNALKFSRDRNSTRVEVGAERQQGEWVIWVSDNGVGLSPEQIQQLFQPFRRMHEGHFEGHGVGLSIVKRVIDRHQGRIWVQSAPGEGSRFCFTLGPSR